MKSKTPSFESVLILFSNGYSSSSLLISSQMRVGSTPLWASICLKPKRFVIDAVKEWITCACFLGVFLWFVVLNSSFTVFSLLKILLKVRKSDFLIRKCGHEFCWLFFCAYQIRRFIFDFSLTFSIERIFVLLFSVSLDIFMVTIIFTMFICGDIKSHPCIYVIHRHKIHWTQHINTS